MNQKPNRGLQRVEAYIRLYGPSKVHPIVEQRWSESNSATSSKLIPVHYRKKIAEELLAQESPEVLAEVDEYRRNYKMPPALDETLDEARKALMQGCIDSLPRALQTLLDKIELQTGWKAYMFTGGPMPKEGGRLTSYIMSSGVSSDEDWEAVQTDFTDTVDKSWWGYLGHCYTARMCHNVSMNQSPSVSSPAPPHCVDGDIVVDNITEPSMAVSNRSIRFTGLFDTFGQMTSAPGSPGSSTSSVESSISSSRSDEWRTPQPADPELDVFSTSFPAVATRQPAAANGHSLPNSNASSALPPSSPISSSESTPSIFSAVSSERTAPTLPMYLQSPSPAAPTPHLLSPTSVSTPPAAPITPTQLISVSVPQSSTLESPIAPLMLGLALTSAAGVPVPMSSASTFPVGSSGSSRDDARPASPPTAPTPVPSPASTPTSTRVAVPQSPPVSVGTSTPTSTPVFDLNLPSVTTTSAAVPASTPTPTLVHASILTRTPTSPHPGPLVGDVRPLREWRSKGCEWLRNVSRDTAWVTLVDQWEAFDMSIDYEDNELLPKGPRPIEVDWWIKRAKDPFKIPSLDTVSKFDTFRRSWISWWTALQPSYRREHQNGQPMPRSEVADAWIDLVIPGSNGIYLIIFTLAWWIFNTRALSDSLGERVPACIVEVMAYVDEVSWAITQITRDVPAALAAKRAREEAKKHSLDAAESSGRKKAKRSRR